IDHLLSFILFVVMAGELVFVPQAAAPTLFLLVVVRFVGFITRFSGHMVQPKRLFLRAPPGPPSIQQGGPPPFAASARAIPRFRRRSLRPGYRRSPPPRRWRRCRRTRPPRREARRPCRG